MSFHHCWLRACPEPTPQASILRFVGGSLVFASIAAGAAGCDDRPPAGSSRAAAAPQDADATGIPLVQNSDRDLADYPAWRVGARMRVGSVDGELAFGRVSDVAPRSAGGMWVLDGQNRIVFGFDESGELALSFGREGDGPGEFRNPSRIVETSNGTIAVSEAFPPVLHWFDVNGSYLETVRVEASRNDDGTRSLPVLAEWCIASDGTPFADVFAVPMAGEEPRVRHSLVRLGGEGFASGLPDTLVRWSVDAPPTDPTADVEIVATKPQWSVGPGPVVWWTPGSPYELRSFGSDGELLTVARLPREATRVTRGLRASIESSLRLTAVDAMGGRAAIDAVLERARWPEALPHVAAVWVSDPDGHVFAAPFASGMFDALPSLLLDVFEADGQYSGMLSLPAGFSPRRFARGSVYGVATDELGVTYAVRHRIEAPE